MNFKSIGQNPSSRRLSFFLNFIDSFGMSRNEFCKTIGLRSTIHINWINADDIALSQIFKVTKRVGYVLKFYIEPKDPKKAEEYRARSIRVNNSHSPYTKNLDFLKDFLEIENVTNSALCASIGISKTRVNYWYNRDDMSLSRLYSIVEAYQKNLHVIFEPYEQVEHCSSSEVLYELHHNYCYPFGEQFGHKHIIRECGPQKRTQAQDLTPGADPDYK